MFLLDRDMRILIAEGEGVRGLPWIGEDMFRGRMVVELQGELPSDVLALSPEYYRGALAGERGEFEFTCAGLSFTVTAVPVHGADGAVESALVVVRDITERTNAERLITERAGQQECVARLGQFALRERDPKRLLDHVLAAVAHTLELDVCVALALRPGGDTLDIVATEGLAAAAVRDVEVPNDPSSLAGHVLSGWGPVVVEDFNTETRFDRPPLLSTMGSSAA